VIGLSLCVQYPIEIAWRKQSSNFLRGAYQECPPQRAGQRRLDPSPLKIWSRERPESVQMNPVVSWKRSVNEGLLRRREENACRFCSWRSC